MARSRRYTFLATPSVDAALLLGKVAMTRPGRRWPRGSNTTRLRVVSGAGVKYCSAAVLKRKSCFFSSRSTFSRRCSS